MDKVHGVAKSQTRLRDFHFTSLHSINPVGGPYVKGQPSTKIIHSLTATSTFCFSGLPAPHPHARHQADTGARLTPQCVVPSLPGARVTRASVNTGGVRGWGCRYYQRMRAEGQGPSLAG